MNDWVWMPHPGHFILGNECRFHLTTYIPKSGVVVSTVGEYVPDSAIRKIYRETRNLPTNKIGDDELYDWLERNGFEDIGHDRKYETMVFKAEATKQVCCPFRADFEDGEKDSDVYNDPGDAYSGHMALCEEWSHEKVR